MFLKQLLKRIYRYMYCPKGTYLNDLRQEKVYLLGSEDFGNLGDHQIAVSELEYLSKYFDNVVEITASVYFKKRLSLLKEIKDTDIIFLTGGGNMGNQYPFSGSIRRDVIFGWPRNIKVVFPQTVFYTKDFRGRLELFKDKFYYRKSNNVIVVAREKESFEFCRKAFNCDVLLTPDIVLSSEKNVRTERENRALTLLRSDVEKKLTKEDEKEINNILCKVFDEVVSDDTQREQDIPKADRDKELLSVFNNIVSSKLVVTDRLHGMVFSAITGTPCIVFQNYNHKVLGTYGWISDLPYIHLVNTVDEMKKVLDTQFYKETYRYDSKKFDEVFGVIMDEVRNKYSQRGIKAEK